MEEIADHCPDRQGHEGRPRAKLGRGRQRLHRKAARRGEAAVVGARLDAQMSEDGTADARHFELELKLFLDALYLRYHYDFRHYSQPSLKRRITAAMTRLDCRSVTQLQ